MTNLLILLTECLENKHRSFGFYQEDITMQGTRQYIAALESWNATGGFIIGHYSGIPSYGFRQRKQVISSDVFPLHQSFLRGAQFGWFSSIPAIGYHEYDSMDEQWWFLYISLSKGIKNKFCLEEIAKSGIMKMKYYRYAHFRM